MCVCVCVCVYVCVYLKNGKSFSEKNENVTCQKQNASKNLF